MRKLIAKIFFFTLCTEVSLAQIGVIQSDSKAVEILPNGIRGGFSAKPTDSTNIAIGKNALLSNTSSHRNIAIGIDALKLFNAPNSQPNTAMIAIGHGALAKYNTTGTVLNITIGNNALGEITQEATSNIIIGHNTSKQNRGDNKIVIGHNALMTGSVDTDNGTYIGHGVASSAPSGTGNTVIGLNAMRFGGNGNNTIIGDGAGGGTSTTSKIGEGNIMLGFRAGELETGSNKLYIENSNSTTPLIGGDFANDKIGINFPISSLVSNFENLQVGGGIFSNGSIRAQNNIQSQNTFVLSMATPGVKDVCADASGKLVPCNSNPIPTAFNVSAMGFQPQLSAGVASSVVQRNVLKCLISFQNNTKKTEASLYAPVELPDGTEIHQMTFHYLQNSGSTMTLKFVSVPKTTNIDATTLISIQSATGSAGVIQEKNGNPNNSILIDNRNFYYYLILETDATWQGSEMALRGVILKTYKD